MAGANPWTQMRSEANQMQHHDENLEVSMNEHEELRIVMDQLRDEMERISDIKDKCKRRKNRSKHNTKEENLIGVAPDQVEGLKTAARARLEAYDAVRQEYAAIRNQFAEAQAAYNAHQIIVNDLREQRDAHRLELRGLLDAYPTLKCIKIVESADITIIRIIKKYFPNKQICFTLGGGLPKLTIRGIKNAARRLGIEEMNKSVVHRLSGGEFTTLTEEQCRDMGFTG